MERYIPSIDEAVWYGALREAGSILGERMARTNGEGEPIDTTPTAADRKTRLRAIRQERRNRYFGLLTETGWQKREVGTGEGVYSPADITPQCAEAMLSVATTYVRRHSTLYAPRPLSEDEREETVARILHYVWTRDYAGSGVYRGSHGHALWGALRLYRKTAWRGESALAAKEAKRRTHQDIDAVHRRIGLQGPTCDNPASIAQAIEEAEGGRLSARAKNNRGSRRKPRRERGAISVDPVARAEAMAVLVQTEDRPRYTGHAEAPQPVPYPVGASCPWIPGRRDCETLAN